MKKPLLISLSGWMVATTTDQPDDSNGAEHAKLGRG